MKKKISEGEAGIELTRLYRIRKAKLTDHYRNKNQNHNEIPSHSSKGSLIIRRKRTNVGEDTEKFLYTSGKCSYYENGCSSKN